MPPLSDELSFPQLVSNATQDSPMTQDPPNNYVSYPSYYDIGSEHLDQELEAFLSDDTLLPWLSVEQESSTTQHQPPSSADANLAGPFSAGAATEIWDDPVLEDAQRVLDSAKGEYPQRCLGDVGPSMVPSQELMKEATVGASSRDAGLLGAAAATAPQPDPASLRIPVGGGGRRHAARCSAGTGTEEAQRDRRSFDAFKAAMLRDLLPGPSLATIQGTRSCLNPGCNADHVERFSRATDLATLIYELEQLFEHEQLTGRRVSSVAFTGPDAKRKRPQGGGWKEKHMKGLRSVTGPQPGQRQLYVGLTKMLEQDDDGSGTRWLAKEYTQLEAAADGSGKLVPAEMSLRVEFTEEKSPELPPLPSPSKLHEGGSRKVSTGPSPVFHCMAEVHVKVVAAAHLQEGTKRKRQPHFKRMFAICAHCDRVFNADSDHGTHNLSNHLKTCMCSCTHSH